VKYETVIGLEAHVQLSTETKAFCGCSAKFGLPPNSSTCPVCLGLPGALPVLNEKAFFYAVKTALALSCKVQNFIKFDRKNYYYPDLPKNFQISQFDKPIACKGFLEIEQNGMKKKIGITRVHLEEDAGKLMHEAKKSVSYVDFNRAGVPLLEIVTEPDLRSPDEASAYLQALKTILQYLKVSDCNMEEGSFRCDANISVRPEGDTAFGTKAELKNINSFKSVRDALSYEVKRQSELAEKKAKITQETRLWDEAGGRTVSMRTKEESHDYRYFPEPDLIPLVESAEAIESVRRSLPELPAAKKKRFISSYSLGEYDANVLTRSQEMSDFFEETARLVMKPKEIANWLLGDVQSALNKKKTTIKRTALAPGHLAEIIKLMTSGEITGKIAKEILSEAVNTGASPLEVVRHKGLKQIKDIGEIDSLVRAVLKENQKSVQDYKKGKSNAIMFLIGQVMKKTKGKANPQKLKEILEERLKDA